MWPAKHKFGDLVPYFAYRFIIFSVDLIAISDLPKIYGGLGISILSTPKGVMSDNMARKNNVGGEILCEVF